MIHCDFFNNHAFFSFPVNLLWLHTRHNLRSNSQLFQWQDPWQPHDPFPFFASLYHKRQLLLGDGLQIDQKISQQFHYRVSGTTRTTTCCMNTNTMAFVSKEDSKCTHSSLEIFRILILTHTFSRREPKRLLVPRVQIAKSSLS